MSDDYDRPAPPNKKQRLAFGEGTSSMTVDYEAEEDFTADPKYNDFATQEEVERLKEFKVLDEVKGDESGDEGSVSSEGSVEVPDDEIERMLDEDLPENFKGAPKLKEKPYVTSEKIVLEEKGVNHFELLPLDWIMVRHYSGMPVYLHRGSRVCTLAKPYFIGTGNAKRHDIPISAIPCLIYRRALEEEEKQNEMDRKRAELIKNGTWDHLIAQAQNCPNKNNMQGIAKNSIRNVIATETMKFYDPKAPKTKVSNIDIHKDVTKATDDFVFKRPFSKKVSKYSDSTKSAKPKKTRTNDNLQSLMNDLTMVADLKKPIEKTKNPICADDAIAYSNKNLISESRVDNMSNNDNSKREEFTVIKKVSGTHNTYININITEKMDTSADDSNKLDLITDNPANKEQTIVELLQNTDKSNTETSNSDNLQNIDNSTNINSSNINSTNIDSNADNSKTGDSTKDPTSEIDIHISTDKPNPEGSHADNLQNTDTSTNNDLNADNSKTADSTKDPTPEIDIPLAAQPVILPGGIVMSPPRVENVNSSWKTQHLSHEQVNEYCKKLFQFKTVKMMHFKRWADKRKYAKARKTLQYPTLPQGTKLITIPAANQQGGDAGAGGSGKAKRDWVMNMNGRSYLSVFHEYVRRALQKQPVYEFQQLENASAPYQATVYIGGMQYGCGRGSSKRAAKANAAKASIQILIPEMKLENDKEDKAEDDHFSFFDNVTIEDPRITEFCLSTCEPSPHAILRTCLLRNFGAGDRHIQTEMKKLENQNIELIMKVGKHSATVVCKNKKTAKQRASQAILQALHPHVKSWGSLLRLYGSRSVKSCKEKKMEEQEITLLQDKAKHNSPNFAVLKKLREEMLRLKERHEAVVPIGTLLLTDDLPKGSSSSLNNVDL